MAQLRHDHSKFEEMGTKVVVVGPDDAQAFAKYWREHDLPFVGLPDREFRVLKLYGQEVKIFKFGRMPAQALIDKAGTVRFVHYDHDMTDIPSTETMLDLIRSLNREHEEMQAPSGTAEDQP